MEPINNTQPENDPRTNPGRTGQPGQDGRNGRGNEQQQVQSQASGTGQQAPTGDQQNDLTQDDGDTFRTSQGGTDTGNEQSWRSDDPAGNSSGQPEHTPMTQEPGNTGNQI